MELNKRLKSAKGKVDTFLRETASGSKEILISDSESNAFENEAIELTEIVDVHTEKRAPMSIFDKNTFSERNNENPGPVPKPRRKLKRNEDEDTENREKSSQKSSEKVAQKIEEINARKVEEKIAKKMEEKMEKSLKKSGKREESDETSVKSYASSSLLSNATFAYPKRKAFKKTFEEERETVIQVFQRSDSNASKESLNLKSTKDPDSYASIEYENEKYSKSRKNKRNKTYKKTKNKKENEESLKRNYKEDFEMENLKDSFLDKDKDQNEYQDDEQDQDEHQERYKQKKNKNKEHNKQKQGQEQDQDPDNDQDQDEYQDNRGEQDQERDQDQEQYRDQDEDQDRDRDQDYDRDQDQDQDIKIKKTFKQKKSTKKLSTSPSNNYDYSKIVSLKILKTDSLLLDSYVIHPVVKVHILDEKSGDYLKKSSLERDILHNQENKTIDYITPIMTKPFNLQENRKLYPVWNETITINEDFNYFVQQKSLILFFEIVDFHNASLINQKGCDPWHYIAWAFLKPHGKYHGRQLRLQLFYARENSGKTIISDKDNKCRAYRWWLKKNKLQKYPSTLYVCLEECAAPRKTVYSWRPKTPHETESSRKENGANGANASGQDVNEGEMQQLLKKTSSTFGSNWQRMENQVCKLPTEKLMEIRAGEDGCLTCKFSRNGLYLAFSVLEDDIYHVVVFSMTTFDQISKFPAHKALIHDMCWSFDNQELICASADCAVSLWDVTLAKYVHMLPHPGYVYACAVTLNKVIATGCYDGYVRIWSAERELLQELRGFPDENRCAYVTSLCFNRDCNLLFSANSHGNLFVFIKSEKRNNNNRRWSFLRQIANLDIDGVVVDQIELHRRERRMLVNTRDSRIRMIDVKTGFVMQTFSLTNQRIQMKCSMSPCGTFVASGSDCGKISIWNVDTGNLEMVTFPYEGKSAVHNVHFHPKDNYLIVSHYGNDFPLILYGLKQKDISATVANPKASEFPPIGGEISSQDGRIVSKSFRVILEKLDRVVTS